MAVPPLVQQSTSKVGTGILGARLADLDDCEGAKFHSPRPLVLNEVRLGGKTVLLCGTCRDNLTVLVHLAQSAPEPLEWPLRREFGNQIRALAERHLRG